MRRMACSFSVNSMASPVVVKKFDGKYSRSVHRKQETALTDSGKDPSRQSLGRTFRPSLLRTSAFPCLTSFPKPTLALVQNSAGNPCPTRLR